MSVASTHRSALGRAHRLERRHRRRVVRSSISWAAAVAAWCLVFVALAWLVAAGFYGLLMAG